MLCGKTIHHTNLFSFAGKPGLHKLSMDSIAQTDFPHFSSHLSTVSNLRLSNTQLWYISAHSRSALSLSSGIWNSPLVAGLFTTAI